MSGSKLSVLGHLRRAGTLTATELADRERVQPQSLTRLIAELEESGFIERTEDESDRRQVLIQITSNGQGILARDARRQDAWLAGVMTARLTGAERDILRAASKLLDRLADEAAAPTGPGEPTG